MGYGTVVFGTRANFEEKRAAIKKIYQKYGMGSWTIKDVHKLWTKRERSLINMNYLKNRNMIEECGWAPGGKIHLWKLTMNMVLMCTEGD
jgi:hypothetical protein